MPNYTYYCNVCSIEEVVDLKTDERDALVGQGCKNCNVGEMRRNFCEGTNKHLDDTPWRKGHYGSKEDKWR